MFELPVSITIDEKDYKIRNDGDFRMVLDCFNALEDHDLDKTYRVYTSLIIFYEILTCIEDIEVVFGNNAETAIKEMFKFFNCGQSNNPGAIASGKVIDWSQDAQLIASAVNNVAKMEVRSAPYLHWWTFMGYYLSVGESPFSMVVSIRDKMKKGKKLEKYEQDFKKDNPQYFNWDSRTKEEKSLEEQLRELWNTGK